MTSSGERHLGAQAAYAIAVRAGDVDAMVALCEPDAVVWHNHDDVAVDIDQSNRMMRWLHRVMPDVSWEDVAVHATANGFVWQAIITGTAPGGPVRAHTCIVVSLSPSGRVQRTDEYLDPAALAPLSSPGS